jgi:hypothetical protein
VPTAFPALAGYGGFSEADLAEMVGELCRGAPVSRLPDDLLDASSASGDPDRCVAPLHRYPAAGVDEVALAPTAATGAAAVGRPLAEVQGVLRGL